MKRINSQAPISHTSEDFQKNCSYFEKFLTQKKLPQFVTIKPTKLENGVLGYLMFAFQPPSKVKMGNHAHPLTLSMNHNSFVHAFNEILKNFTKLSEDLQKKLSPDLI